MKVLVTGATGLLGHHIVFELIKKKHQVICLVRPNSNIQYLRELDVEFIEGDMLNSNDLYTATRGIDIIINAAANTSQKENNVEKYRAINIDAPKVLFRCAEVNKVRKFIHVSSAAVFGYGSSDKPGSEVTPFKKPFKNIAYVQSKKFAQNWIIQQTRQSNVEAVVINPSLMIGAYDLGPSSGLILETVINNKLVIVPPGGKSFIHVRDVAKASVNAIDKGENGECYLLSNENLSFNQALPLIASTLKLKRRFVRIPKVILVPIGFIGSILSRFGMRSGLTLHNARSLCVNQFFDSSKAEKKLQIKYTDFEDAIQEYFDWRNTHHQIKKAS